MFCYLRGFAPAWGSSCNRAICPGKEISVWNYGLYFALLGFAFCTGAGYFKRVGMCLYAHQAWECFLNKAQRADGEKRIEYRIKIKSHDGKANPALRLSGFAFSGEPFAGSGCRRNGIIS